AEWVRENTPRHAVLVCFPMPNRLTVEAYESATMWMIWQTRHERRMVNGYSAFTPQSHLTLQQRVARFPDDASLRALAEWGVTYCVVKRSAGAPSLERVTTDGRWCLQPVFVDNASVTEIYEIAPLPLPEDPFASHRVGP
ncbi:MAG: hypothetical protein KDA62_17590, partial [Planctomycetales bacterium]|nr:hypothetical protein [Planctomycetales bacterium]